MVVSVLVLAAGEDKRILTRHKVPAVLEVAAERGPLEPVLDETARVRRGTTGEVGKVPVVAVHHVHGRIVEEPEPATVPGCARLELVLSGLL